MVLVSRRYFFDAVAQVQLDVDPVLVAGQRGLRRGVGVVRVEGARRVVVDLRQLQGQHRLGQRVGDAVLVVDDREGLAPVALAAEQPVAQPEVDGALADAALGQPVGDLRLGLDDAQAVQRDLVVGGVDQLRLVGGERVVPRRGVGAAVVGGLHDAAHGQLEGAREGEVTGVVRRYGHDRAGAVAHQYVVGDEDGNFFAADRVDGERAGEDAGLLLGARPGARRPTWRRRTRGTWRRPRPGWRARRSTRRGCPRARRPGRWCRPARARGPAPCRWRRTGCPGGW